MSLTVVAGVMVVVIISLLSFILFPIPFPFVFWLQEERRKKNLCPILAVWK